MPLVGVISRLVEYPLEAHFVFLLWDKHSLGCVPMFWAFLPNFTCGLVPKSDWGVSNFCDKELTKPVVDLQANLLQGKICHEGHANHT